MDGPPPLTAWAILVPVNLHDPFHGHILTRTFGQMLSGSLRGYEEGPQGFQVTHLLVYAATA